MQSIINLQVFETKRFSGILAYKKTLSFPQFWSLFSDLCVIYTQSEMLYAKNSMFNNSLKRMLEINYEGLFGHCFAF
jgi:hypothetical protein